MTIETYKKANEILKAPFAHSRGVVTAARQFLVDPCESTALHLECAINHYTAIARGY